MNVIDEQRLMWQYRARRAYVKAHNIWVPDDLLTPLSLQSGKNTIVSNCTELIERIVRLTDLINIYRQTNNLEQIDPTD